MLKGTDHVALIKFPAKQFTVEVNELQETFKVVSSQPKLNLLESISFYAARPTSNQRGPIVYHHHPAFTQISIMMLFIFRFNVPT